MLKITLHWTNMLLKGTYLNATTSVRGTRVAFLSDDPDCRLGKGIFHRRFEVEWQKDSFLYSRNKT